MNWFLQGCILFLHLFFKTKFKGKKLSDQDKWSVYLVKLGYGIWLRYYDSEIILKNYCCFPGKNREKL